MKDEVTNVLRLANLVRENVRAKQLFTPDNSILVTLSGGQDSICSLLLLYMLQNQLGLEFEVASRLTGTTFQQSRTKPALKAAGAARRAAPSGRAPLRVVRPRRRPLGPFVLVRSLYFAERGAVAQRLDIERASPADSAIGNRTLLGKSAPKTSQTAANSYLYPTGPEQTLFDFENSARFIGQFGLLWCNHFWQKESFCTMLHVAKINLCFASTMCFYLPIKSVLCEQNAREWRHKSIQRTCAFFHFECCTQGHTKSDRVETILFNILRGTGIAGLQSLQWKKSFYSFSCQRFYPRLSYYKLNWPHSTAPLLKLPPVERGSFSANRAGSRLCTVPTGLELYKVGGFSKYCLVNVRTEPTFRLSTRCSYRPRRRLGLSTASIISFTWQPQVLLG